MRACSPSEKVTVIWPTSAIPLGTSAGAPFTWLNGVPLER